jgi:hypothetical protein
MPDQDGRTGSVMSAPLVVAGWTETFQSSQQMWS